MAAYLLVEGLIAVRVTPFGELLLVNLRHELAVRVAAGHFQPVLLC